jgi:uncharacterized protein
MKISLANLSDGIHTFHFSAEASDIGLEERVSRDLAVDVTLDKSNRELLLRAEISTWGRLTCDRCIDEFEHELQGRFQIVCLYDERERSQFQDDEVHILDPGASVIDITDDVRQLVLLAVPLKVLCRKDCQGLCPKCGANRNRGTCTCNVKEVDPRWKDLERLTQN